MAELAGTWILRNFNPTFVTGNETREENAFIAGALDLTLSPTPDPLSLGGTIGWRGDPPRDPPGVLDVNGTIDQSHGLGNEMFYLTATGRGDTPTAGWQYDYHGRPGRNWALRDGGRVDRHPTLVGSSRAGEVLSFIAVKPQQAREDMGTYDLTGSWTYRSFRNDAQGPPPRPNGLILQEAILKLETKPETVPARRSPEPPFAIIEPSYTKTILGGTIEWSGRVLDIKGEVLPVKFEGRPQEFWFSATGRGGTASAGWQYDYHGDMTQTWPKGDRASSGPSGHRHPPKGPWGLTGWHRISLIAVQQ